MNWHDHVGAIGGGGAAAIGAAWLLLKDLLREWWAEHQALNRLRAETAAKAGSKDGDLINRLLTDLEATISEQKQFRAALVPMLERMTVSGESISKLLMQMDMKLDWAHDQLLMIRGAVSKAKGV